MTRKSADVDTTVDEMNDDAASVKLSTFDRQRISNLRAMAQTIRGVIDAIKEGDAGESFDMTAILAAQFQLVTQLGEISARKARPVSAPPAQTEA